MKVSRIASELVRLTVATVVYHPSVEDGCKKRRRHHTELALGAFHSEKPGIGLGQTGTRPWIVRPPMSLPEIHHILLSHRKLRRSSSLTELDRSKLTKFSIISDHCVQSEGPEPIISLVPLASTPHAVTRPMVVPLQWAFPSMGWSEFSATIHYPCVVRTDVLR